MTVTVRSTTNITDYVGMKGVISPKDDLYYVLKNNLNLPKRYSEAINGRGQTIKWLKDKRTKGQTMIYNALPRKLRIDN